MSFVYDFSTIKYQGTRNQRKCKTKHTPKDTILESRKLISKNKNKVLCVAIIFVGSTVFLNQLILNQFVFV